MISYGFLTGDDNAIELSLDDALYADRLDYQFGHSRPMRDFDPFDHKRVAVQDCIYAEGRGLPNIYAGWATDLMNGIKIPRWYGNDEKFEAYTRAIHDCCLLPIEDGFHDALVDLWVGWIVPETERRIAVAERRLRMALQHGNGSDWQTADLVAEIEAVCGPGRNEGRQVAFPCPFHEDRHPSMKVDPVKKTWWCWPCRKGGGVVAWRRTQGQ